MSFDNLLKTDSGKTTNFKPTKKPSIKKKIFWGALITYFFSSVIYTTIKILIYFL